MLAIVESTERTLKIALGATAIAIALAMAILASGCGGGVESPEEEVRNYAVQADTTITTAAPPLTKARFVAHVNRICLKAWAKVIENFDTYSGWQERTRDKRERIAEAIQLSLLAGLDFHIFDNIYNLGSPRGEERTIERIVGPFQAAVEIGQQAPDINQLARVPERFAEYNRRARRYGLNECLVDWRHLRRIET